MRTALLAACLLAAPAAAAELAYPRGSGGAAEAAETARTRLGADRAVAGPDAVWVADAVRSGAVAFGLLPDEALEETLLAALDPGLRILRRVDAGGATLWTVEQSGGKANDHPDHVAVNIESARGAKAFSAVVAGLGRLGLAVEDVSRSRLPGRDDEGRPLIRWMIVFGADKPMLLLRITDVLARDVRIGDGRARLIGAWREAG